ncbi:hypothetical protein [Yersinia enterocolitica]|uniref:hypothetical protein n=1 Tax=Yersinia enterocolitica TaxID=630 RepID=UPI003D78C74E
MITLVIGSVDIIFTYDEPTAKGSQARGSFGIPLLAGPLLHFSLGCSNVLLANKENLKG